MIWIDFIAHSIYSYDITRNITVTPQAGLTKFYLLCVVSTTPKPLFAWIRNDVAIQPNNRIRIVEESRQLITHSSYLLFNPVKATDQGKYTCKITQTVTGVNATEKTTLG